ncbi:MAG: efflux RND transporter permease subunit [Myxococcales bacterium]|nr:efflux RND transporter permease subunit [Deltaproteobacteria bacterium]NNL25242.1 efflux RND transporter permease subunit [Myxococcales bacterium]
MTDESAPSDEKPTGLIWVAIQRPISVVVGIVLVILFGTLSVMDLPIQLTPDIATPTISVSTAWPGAAPVEIETEILEPQEEVLKNVQGLTRMESSASMNSGSITLEFEVDTDIEEALVRVTNNLSQVSSYPDSVREPTVQTANSAGPPLAVIAIRDPKKGSVAAYRTWVEDEVLPEIDRIPGVAGIFFIGGQDTEVHVLFDAQALGARGLSVQDVADRVRSELRDLSGGDVTLGKRRYLVRTAIAPETPSALEEVVLGASSDGTPILLGDVATVKLALRKPVGVALVQDRPAMVMLLSREAGTNVLEVTREVHEVVARLQREKFDREGLQIEILADQVEYIEGALDLVQQNLLLGAFLAVIVLFLFLRTFGASAVVSIAIPVCAFATALGMQALGRTINVVSLAGITFAIGMVVDNSIVALESIDTYRTRAPDTKLAAYRGIRDVWGALIASTATTVAVFIPIVLWQGEVGELLRDVAVAIALAVTVSLVVSVLVIPSLAARLLSQGKTLDIGGLTDFGRRFRSRVTEQVRWLCSSTRRSLSTVVFAVVASLLVAWALLPPMEYLPTGNRNLVFGILIPPPGYSIEELDATGNRLQGQMAKYTGVETDGEANIRRSFFVGSPDRVFAGAVAEHKEDVGRMLDLLRRVQSKIPGMISFATQASLFGRSIGGGRVVEIDIQGPDLQTLSEVGGRLFGDLRGALPGAQIRPVPSLDPGAPELHVIPRRKEAAQLQMGGAELGLVVDALIDGAIIGEYTPEGSPKLDVVMRAVADGERLLPDAPALLSAPVATPSGRTVPLGSLAEIEERLGPSVIRHLERRRAITLNVSPPEDLALEDAIDTIRNDVIGDLEREGAVPSDVQFALSGAAGKLELAQKQFGNILLLALVICFLLIAALFEDFISPLAVLMSVPLAAAGGAGGLWLVNALLGKQPLDLMTALGFLILIGVVVNNAILVVDGSISRLRAGSSLREAVPLAVEARVRPIFMTTATSLAGLLPMVIFSGSGSELYRGVGAIVLGGLLLSTLFTLFVVPTAFTLLWRLRGHGDMD